MEKGIPESRGENGHLDAMNYFKLLEPRSESEYEDVLNHLKLAHPLFIELLLARRALRLLPLLSIRGDFDFLLKKNDEHLQRVEVKDIVDDPRLISLLACFQCGHEVLRRIRPHIKSVSRIHVSKEESEGLRRIADVVNNYVAAANILEFVENRNDFSSGITGCLDTSSSDLISYFLSDIDSHHCKTLIKFTATAAAAVHTRKKDPSGLGHESVDIAALRQDIEVAMHFQDIESLLNAPLWNEKIPGVYLELQQESFFPAVEQLKKELNNPQAAQALTHMLSLYDAMLYPASATTRSKTSEKIAPESNRDEAEDFLSRGRLVGSLSRFLSHADNPDHLTVGLFGHWGAGKTRVIDLLKEQLQQQTESSFIVGEFNAWAYEHSDNIQAAMAHEIINSLTTCPYLTPTNTPSQPSANTASHAADSSVSASDKPPNWRIVLGNFWAQVKWNVIHRPCLSLQFAAYKFPVRCAVWLMMLLLLLVVPTVYGMRLPAGGLEKFVDSLVDNSAFQAQVGVSALVLITGFLGWYRQAKVLFSQSFTKEFLTYIKLPSYAKHIGQVAEMRKDIHLMCDLRLQSGSARPFSWLGKAKHPKRLLFVIDDLDRCDPEGIIKTFEAIRLILDIPHVKVVLAIDQRVALAALALHYQKIEQYHGFNEAKTIARNYLGKMVQLPVMLSAPKQGEVSQYMDHVWGQDREDQQWHHALAAMQGTSTHAETASETAASSVASDQPVDNHSSADEGLSEAALIQQMLDTPAPNIPPAAVVDGLTDLQKAAFVYWSHHFSLVNPRQLKRLYNSYNLLCLSQEAGDRIAITDTSYSYGLLVSLLLLESVNSKSEQERKHSLHMLESETISGNDTDWFAEPLRIIDQAAQQSLPDKLQASLSSLSPTRSQMIAARQQYLATVALFVLPAVEESLPV